MSAHPNPAHHRFHVIEHYRSRVRAVQRVSRLNVAGFKAYMVVSRRYVIVHVSEGKRGDLYALPRRGGKRP